jgi:hypothetical protein
VHYSLKLDSFTAQKFIYRPISWLPILFRYYFFFLDMLLGSSPPSFFDTPVALFLIDFFFLKKKLYFSPSESDSGRRMGRQYVAQDWAGLDLDQYHKVFNERASWLFSLCLLFNFLFILKNAWLLSHESGRLTFIRSQDHKRQPHSRHRERDSSTRMPKKRGRRVAFAFKMSENDSDPLTCTM